MGDSLNLFTQKHVVLGLRIQPGWKNTPSSEVIPIFGFSCVI